VTDGLWLIAVGAGVGVGLATFLVWLVWLMKFTERLDEEKRKK